MTIPTVKIELTVHELVSIADVLKKARSESDYRIERENFLASVYPKDADGKTDYSAKPVEKTLDTWAIKQARDDLVERARLAALVAKLTGEELTDDREAVEERIAQAQATYPQD